MRGIGRKATEKQPGTRLVASRLPLLFAFLMSLAAARFAYLSVDGADPAAGLSFDETNYIATAERLLTDRVFSFWGDGPDAYVSPGYPVFLTIVFALFGTGIRGITAVRLLQCLMTGATVFLTYRLGRTLTGRDACGLIAASLVFLNGGFYVYARMILTETLYFFLMMLSFVLLAEAEKRERPPLFFWGGLAFGCAVMVRSLVAVTLPFLLLPRLIRHCRDRSGSLRPVLLMLAGFLIPCVPWWIRNVITLRRLVFWATQTNPVYAGLSPDPVADGLADPGTYAGNFRLLFGLLKERPRATLSWMTFGKFNIIFMNNDAWPMQILTEIVRNVTVVLGFSGVALALFTREARRYAVPFCVYFICILFSVPVVRYSFQYLLLLAVFAGWLLGKAWERIRAVP